MWMKIKPSHDQLYYGYIMPASEQERSEATVQTSKAFYGPPKAKKIITKLEVHNISHALGKKLDNAVEPRDERRKLKERALCVMRQLLVLRGRSAEFDPFFCLR